MGGRGARNKNDSRTNISGLVNGKGPVTITAQKMGDDGRYHPMNATVQSLAEKNGFIVHKALDGKGFNITHAASGTQVIGGAKKQDALNSIKNAPKLSAKSTREKNGGKIPMNDLKKIFAFSRKHYQDTLKTVNKLEGQ